MNKNLFIGSFTTLAIVVSFYLLLHQPADKGEQIATNVSEALGQQAAVEAVRILGNGRQAAVVGIDFQPGQAPTYEATLKAFRQKMKQKGIKIAATTTISGGLNMMMLGMKLSPKEYAALLAQSPVAGVVVSFVGAPNMTPVELNRFQSNRPPLIVVDIFGRSNRSELEAMVAEKSVAVAFVQRSGLEIEKEKQQANLIDRYYETLRAPGSPDSASDTRAAKQ